VTDPTMASLRHDHAEVRRLIARLRLIDSELNSAEVDVRLVRRALDDVLADMVRHVFRSMRDEEIVAYPPLERALGSDVPVLALLAEHRVARESVRALRALMTAGGQEAVDRRLPAEVKSLADELERHLRREEAAFGALVHTAGTVSG